MINFSVMISFGWWDDGVLDTRALLERITAHGAAGVEVSDVDIYTKPEMARRFPGWLAANNLELVAVDVISNLVHKDAQARQRGRESLRRGLDICVEQGARVAHCVGSLMADGVTPSDGRKMIADQLAEQVDEYTDKHGLVLAIENYGLAPELICSKDDCLEVLARAKGRVKMVFDTGNFLAVGERAEDNLDACYDQIVMCHFKDWTSASHPMTATAAAHFESSRLGEGIIHNPQVAEMLIDRGFDGWISLESCMHPGETVDQTLSRELTLLKSWFKLT